MTDSPAAANVVQCGWCPLLLANDWQVWYRHFREVHRIDGSYSIRHIISSDWDMRELVSP